MLVLIGNLRLNDGTLDGPTATTSTEKIESRLGHLLQQNLHNVDPLQEIDVILLGDTFDLLSSNEWHNQNIRPWDNPHSPRYVNVVQTIVEKILQRHAGFFAECKGLVDSSPARVHYLVGDADWMLHLFGPAYDVLRERICNKLGLSNPAGIPFPHEPIESTEVLQTLCQHNVFARHGDIHDPWSCEGDRRASSVGDTLLVELIVPFMQDVVKLNENLDSVAIVSKLVELRRFEPRIQIARRIDQVLHTHDISSSITTKIRSLWNDHVDHFLALPFLRTRECWHPIDLVAALRKLLTISDGHPHQSHLVMQKSLERGFHRVSPRPWIPNEFLQTVPHSPIRQVVQAHHLQSTMLRIYHANHIVSHDKLLRAA